MIPLCEQAGVVENPREIISFYEDIINQMKNSYNELYDTLMVLKNKTIGNIDEQLKESEKCKLNTSLCLRKEVKEQGEEKRNLSFHNTDILNDILCNFHGKDIVHRGGEVSWLDDQEEEGIEPRRRHTENVHEYAGEKRISEVQSNEDFFQERKIKHVNCYKKEFMVRNIREKINDFSCINEMANSNTSICEVNNAELKEGEQTHIFNGKIFSQGRRENVEKQHIPSSKSSNRHSTDLEEEEKEKEKKKKNSLNEESLHFRNSFTCMNKVDNEEVKKDLTVSKKNYNKNENSNSSPENFADLNFSDNSMDSIKDVMIRLSQENERLSKIVNEKKREYENGAYSHVRNRNGYLCSLMNVDQLASHELENFNYREYEIGEQNKHCCKNLMLEKWRSTCSKNCKKGNRMTNIYNEQIRKLNSDCSERNEDFYKFVQEKKKKKKKNFRKNGPILRNVRSTTCSTCCNDNTTTSHEMSRESCRDSNSMMNFKHEHISTNNITNNCICSGKNGKDCNTCYAKKVKLKMCKAHKVKDQFRLNDTSLSEIYLNDEPHMYSNYLHVRRRNQLMTDQMKLRGKKREKQNCPFSFETTNLYQNVHSKGNGDCNKYKECYPIGDDENTEKEKMDTRNNNHEHFLHDEGKILCKDCNDDETNIQDSISVLEEKLNSIIDGSTETIQKGNSNGRKFNSLMMKRHNEIPYHNCDLKQNVNNNLLLGHYTKHCGNHNICLGGKLQKIGNSNRFNSFKSDTLPYGFHPPRSTYISSLDQSLLAFFPEGLEPSPPQMQLDVPMHAPFFRGTWGACKWEHDKGSLSRCSHGRCSHGRCSHGRCSHGRCSHDRCSRDKWGYDTCRCQIVNHENVVNNQLFSNYIDINVNPALHSCNSLDTSEEQGTSKERHRMRETKGIEVMGDEGKRKNELSQHMAQYVKEEWEMSQTSPIRKKSNIVEIPNTLNETNEKENNDTISCRERKKTVTCISTPGGEVISSSDAGLSLFDGLTAEGSLSERCEEDSLCKSAEKKNIQKRKNQVCIANEQNRIEMHDKKEKKKKEKCGSIEKYCNETRKTKKKKKKKKKIKRAQNVKKYYESNPTNLFWTDLHNAHITQVNQTMKVMQMAQLIETTHTDDGNRNDRSMQLYKQYNKVNLGNIHKKKYELRTKRKVKYAWPSIHKKLRRDGSRLVYDPFLYNSTWRIKKV
ncbi:hypothetical protein PGO_050440 [Plasmodium gonderi]|uniref:Uncharacterized protein n=1 Tax=Plasmodium gonderi TaxID=77519 RepID=A0A1Y1JHS3_PLAGO|nr:hypothetical protein PGO_050440 [Plasmodium gonderi]GAW79634.1 hypothetical protein PGO_050440 [Plasmodium gonderi]